MGLGSVAADAEILADPHYSGVQSTCTEIGWERPARTNSTTAERDCGTAPAH
jgi:hypothetical protein